MCFSIHSAGPLIVIAGAATIKQYRDFRTVAQKRGQEPIVRSTLRAIWLLVPDPFSEAGIYVTGAARLLESG